MQLFRTQEIAKALDLSPRWLTSQLERQLIPCQRPGSGALREFAHHEVHRIALMHVLVGLGTQPVKASKFAGEFYHATGLLIIHPSGTAEVLPIGTGAPIPGSAVIVNLDQLRRDVDARLPIAA